MVVEITLVMVLQDFIEKFPICKDTIFGFAITIWVIPPLLLSLVANHELTRIFPLRYRLYTGI